MIGNVKRLQIANVCYANVAGEFAMYSNPKYRGPNFTWERFIDQCERHADIWMMIHVVYTERNKDDVNKLAKQFAREIAETLVERMGELE